MHLIAPRGNKLNEANYRSLSRSIGNLQNTMKQGLKFVRIDMETGRIVVILDASLANTKGLKSQLGYSVLMADAIRTANIVKYGYNRSHRVSRSAMTVEVHALVHAFDIAYVICDTLQNLLGRDI